MLNDFWEEKFMNNDINSLHNSELESWGFPAWVTKIECPMCGSKLCHNSIRSMTLKLNTRNLGDIAIEILCNSCQKMDTVYLRVGCNSVSDFCKFLDGSSELDISKTKPIIEEAMYKMEYNNFIEKTSKKGDKNAI